MADNPDTETLIRYLDGELDAAESATIEAKFAPTENSRGSRASFDRAPCSFTRRSRRLCARRYRPSSKPWSMPASAGVSSDNRPASQWAMPLRIQY